MLGYCKAANHRYRRPIRFGQVHARPNAGARAGSALHRHRLDVSSVALAVIQSAIKETDDVAVGVLAERSDIDLAGDPDSLRVKLNNRDVSDRIRDEDVTHISSVVSTIPAVRRAMVLRQRAMGERGAVMNGRDIGTVVFPTPT